MPLKSVKLDANQLSVVEFSEKKKNFVLADFGPVNPLPMQYLGAKGRISRWIISNIDKEFPRATKFVDLFAGTGAVSIEAAAHGYDVVLNDIQPYSYAVLSSVFEKPKLGLAKLADELHTYVTSKSNLLSGSRKKLRSYLKEEDLFVESLKLQKFAWTKYRKFNETTPRYSTKTQAKNKKALNNHDLFSWYYPNTYFGIRQCLEIDTIREFADSKDVNTRAHILAAVISALTFTVSSTTHLAQFIKPNTKKQAEFLLRKRTKSIVDSVIHRLRKLSECSDFSAGKVYNLDYLEALKKIPASKSTVVYADPPYFKEHYSRYYHVLDTFYLYDYPELSLNPQTGSLTEGKYRTNRIISDFGLRSKVENAFSNMLRVCKSKGFSVAISYANTSLIDKAKMTRLITASGYKILSLEEKGLMHSAQGQPSNKIALEYLYLLVPQDEQ